MHGTKFDNILETVGRTPVVRLNKLAPEGVTVYVKVEAFNPMGSVKDRMALSVIEDAERSGELRPGQTVIEATSGNTGIGLAMVCAQKGYPLVVTMAENFSVERRKLMRFLGAKVVLTPASARGTGMLDKAIELAAAHDWFLCHQFENEANADAHSRTTAREILDDFDGESLDYWVTGFGTGGTLKGVARVLRDERPDTRIAVCEPDNSGLLGSGMAQARNADGTPSAGHPAFRTHMVQGWSPDFIAKLAEDAAASGYIDELVAVGGDEALDTARRLARREGIFTGISGGATLAGALRLAREAPEGTSILCMLPDTGERYLSTPLFDDVAEEMTVEEVEISRSTANYRFDQAAPKDDETTDDGSALLGLGEVQADAANFVEEAISDRSQPVVLFALEWCEFCWSIRKLLDACEVTYRSIDLDSAESQRDDWGHKVHTALAATVGATTLPQLFIAGERVGGCTETVEAYRDGTLQRLLTSNNIPFDDTALANAENLLPKWLQPRDTDQSPSCDLNPAEDPPAT